jgi:hypothetical protein
VNVTATLQDCPGLSAGQFCALTEKSGLFGVSEATTDPVGEPPAFVICQVAVVDEDTSRVPKAIPGVWAGTPVNRAGATHTSSSALSGRPSQSLSCGDAQFLGAGKTAPWQAPKEPFTHV